MKSFSTKMMQPLLVAAIAILAVSCSRKISFLTSAEVPAARGFVKVKKDNNRNYVIQVELNNLAEVERLQPARKAYVIWMETSEEAVKNIGQIKSASRMLSSKLNASFHSVSALKPTKIFITAEEDAGIQYPGNPVLLTTNGF
jgi:hypothetical protein